jgi:hypothetical protein
MREQETELSQTRLSDAAKAKSSDHRKTTVSAPVLDHFTNNLRRPVRGLLTKVYFCNNLPSCACLSLVKPCLTTSSF